MSRHPTNRAEVQQNAEKERTRPAGSVVVREAQFNRHDLEGMWGLFRSQLQAYRTCSLSQFCALYDQLWLHNPARTSEDVIGWVLQTQERSIAGFIGILPVKLKIGDCEISAGAAHSWVVLPMHRAHSLSLYKALMSWAERRMLLTTTSRELAGKVHQRFGMNKIPVADFARQAFWLFKPEVALEATIARSGWKRCAEYCHRFPLNIVVKGLLRARFIGHQFAQFKCAKMAIEPVHAFGEEFDRLWEDNKNDFAITTVRDRKFLQWRHFQVPGVLGRTSVFACRDRGRIRGYVAVQVRRGEVTAVPNHYTVTDLFYERSCKDVFYNLLNQVFALARSGGCAVLEVSDFSGEVMAELERLHPYIRQSRAWTYWYKAPTSAIAETCATQAWWPSGIDGDSNL